MTEGLNSLSRTRRFQGLRRFHRAAFGTIYAAAAADLVALHRRRCARENHRTGELYSTQIACLNDATEFTYAGQLLRDAIKKAKPLNDDNTYLRDKLVVESPGQRAAAEGRFVTCFSALGDDLSQWRAYSGGENGYSIGFDGAQLRSKFYEAHSHLMPVAYREAHQQNLADALAEATLRFFREGFAKSNAPSRKDFESEFLRDWGELIVIFAPLMKHPTFAAEAEWRIVRLLRPGDEKRLVIRQKQTLLARHLPLDLCVGDRMPLVKVIVGPSRHKDVSRISVGDLLKKHEYDPDLAGLSKVPFEMT